jgi:predicted GNAT superfamily acetyltransferase
MHATTPRNAAPPDFAAIVALNAKSAHVLSPLTNERLEALHRSAAYQKVTEADDGVAAFLLAFREGAPYDGPNDFAMGRLLRLLSSRRVIGTQHPKRRSCRRSSSCSRRCRRIGPGAIFASGFEAP